MDPLDEISNLNKIAYDEGYKEGEEKGKQAAVLNGFQIGKQMSFGITKELGQYYGTMLSYKINNGASVIGSEQKSFKLAEQLCELIEEFDYTDCHGEQFNFKLSHIRDKYKQFCSLTNLKSYANQITFASTASKFSFWLRGRVC